MKKGFTLIELLCVIIIIAIAILILFGLTGCNKQILDFEYTFDKVICNYDGDQFELEIDKWTDYEGEQIQVKSNGKTYLLSANHCYLIGE